MQSTPEFLKSQWMDIEELARQGGIDQDQFRLLYRKAYNADPDQGVLQTLFGTQGPEAEPPPGPGTVVTGGGTEGQGSADDMLSRQRALEEQELRDPAGVYSRWLQGQEGFRTASPFLRNAARSRAGEMATLYGATTAARPDFFTEVDVGEGKLEPRYTGPQGTFAEFLSRGNRATQGEVRSGLGNIANVIPMDPDAVLGNPFAKWAQGEFGDTEEGQRNAINALIQSGSMGYGAGIRRSLQRGMGQAFADWQDVNPGRNVLLEGKRWGYY